MPYVSNELNIFQIYDIALSQGIWQTVFLAVKRLYEQGELTVDKTVFESWRREVLHQAIQAVQRNAAVADVINVLEQNGIQCCVLKGETHAELYAEPSCRISADTDILIDKNFINKAA